MELQAPLGQWLDEVRRRDLVTRTPREDQALSNMTQFPLSAARLAGVTVASMCAFLVAAFREYGMKAERAGVSGTFYAWVDQVAGQMRCSFVEDVGSTRLPFACPVSAVTTPEPVASAALEGQLGDKIPWSELKEIEWSEPDEDAGEHVLNVYARQVEVVR